MIIAYFLYKKQFMKYLIFLLTVFFVAQTMGQQKKTEEVRAIEIGEKVPDIIFSKIVNSHLPTAKLSDYKGKLVILDFWTATCSTCIQFFPELAKLQEKFKDDLIILPVGFDGVRNKNDVLQILEKKKGTALELKLPCAIEDNKTSILRKLFPASEAPYEIWIDGDGILRAKTGSKGMTVKNINMILSSKKAKLINKKRTRFLYDGDSLLFGNISNLKIDIPKSKFAKYIDTINGSMGLRIDFENASHTRVMSPNQPILGSYFRIYTLYSKDFASSVFLDESMYFKRVIHNFHSSDSRAQDNRSIENSDDQQYEDYCKNSLFCYEAILPLRMSKENVYKFVIEDFDKHFEISSSLENRRIKCFALISLDASMPFKSIKTIPKMEYNMAEGIHEVFEAMPVATVINSLNHAFKSYLVLNETKYYGNIDLNLEGVKANDLHSYKKALKNAGLDLIEVEREIPMLVLKDLKRK